MLVIAEPEQFQSQCETWRHHNHRLAFVPTMGALHEGHAALLRHAHNFGDTVIASIFINPKQFSVNEDLNLYPKALEKDLEICRTHGVQAVFVPNATGIYPPGFQSSVQLSQLSQELEGVQRPSHFQGVCTVVTILLNLCGACSAIFGKKDYQQWKIIEQLVRDLRLPARIEAYPIVRDQRGLALSSRNRYLNAENYNHALSLVRALRVTAQAFDAGERSLSKLLQLCHGHLPPTFLDVDYVAIRHPETLRELDEVLPDQALLAIAARIGGTRLIDNTVLGNSELITRA